MSSEKVLTVIKDPDGGISSIVDVDKDDSLDRQDYIELCSVALVAVCQYSETPAEETIKDVIGEFNSRKEHMVGVDYE